jgi:hypothetical protein
MTTSRLPNYLIANRKNLGLSQVDVGYLLGEKTGEKVCRHELFLREPSLADVLAYEAIYKRSASELFGGLYKQIEDEVAARAKSLAEEIRGHKPTKQNGHRRRILTGIANMGSN